MEPRQKGKICIVSDSLEFGGAERSAGLLATCLETVGYDVHLIIFIDAVTYPFSGKLHNLGRRVPGDSTSIKLRRYRIFHKLLKTEAYDLIIDFRMKNHLVRELGINLVAYRSEKVINMVRSFQIDWQDM